MFYIEDNPVIAAIRTDDEFEEALKCPSNVIFLLNANILTLEGYVLKAHKNNKRVFVHIDIAEGIGKDRFGIEFISKVGVDGIISTRGNVIKMARDFNLKTVQRFFIVDSHSIDTAIEHIKSFHPDMVEIMPGVIPKIITRFCKNINIPIITGGLIETKEDIINALNAGAKAISTATIKLWYE